MSRTVFAMTLAVSIVAWSATAYSRCGVICLAAKAAAEAAEASAERRAAEVAARAARTERGGGSRTYNWNGDITVNNNPPPSSTTRPRDDDDDDD
jgi:hypothetical protein